ncbi:hypothetical protein [uncultured Akkermansia sp.]|uniref:hypothetical protein n=1 Tax=uncultured Akkermansia sp. TaxID=512294 RepID=UPI0025CEDAC3|nr:hypothetical protein [uncultured Akkermansia sp.]
MKKDIDGRKLQFGATLLNTKENARVLYLIDNSIFDTVGRLHYFIKTGKGIGEIGGNKIEISQINSDSYCINTTEQEYCISRLDDIRIRISYKRSRYIDFFLQEDLNNRLIRKSLVYDNIDRQFEVSISRNQTILYFLRMIIGLLSFGLLKQPKTSIIPPLFDADDDMQKALVLGIIAIQMIYCPYDYDNWS